jgi:type IV secretion system protein VirD4
MSSIRYGLAPRHDVLLTSGCVIAGLVLGQWAVSQWLAEVFEGQAALGRPWFRVGDAAIYAPWAWVRWARHLPALYLERLRSAVLLAVAVPLLLPAVVSLWKRRPDGHGSARWAKRRELRRAGLLGAVRRGGVYVGAWRRKGRAHYLRHDGPEHVLAFAPTRSGKGVGLVIPTLLSWRESVVVLDIKGENWEATAGWRQQGAGQRVIRFDPGDAGSARFNPLAEIRLRSPYEVADAQSIATMLVDPKGEGFEDKHWSQTAWSLLVGAIVHVCYREANRGKKGTLAAVADELSGDGDYAKLAERWLHFDHAGADEPWSSPSGLSTTHPLVSSVAREMAQRPEKYAASVLSTARALLTLYRDPLVARATSESDFRVRDLIEAEVPCTLYLVVRPGDLKRVRPLLRLMLTQILYGLMAEHPEAPGPNVPSWSKRVGRALKRDRVEEGRRRVLLMLDEFASLGKLEILQEALAYCAGYGVKAYLIVQGLEQLYAAYGRNESIVGNCHIRVAFAPNKIETAELLSKMTGTTTVPSRTFAAKTREKRFHGRPLLTPDECMRLRLPEKDRVTGRVKAGEALILSAGLPPIYGEQILYFEDAEFRRRAALGAPTVSDARPETLLSRDAREMAARLLGAEESI